MKNEMQERKLLICDPEGCDECKMKKAMEMLAFRSMMSLGEYFLDEHSEEMWELFIDILECLRLDAHYEQMMKLVVQFLKHCDEGMAAVLELFVQDDNEKVICFVQNCAEVGSELITPF